MLLLYGGADLSTAPHTAIPQRFAALAFKLQRTKKTKAKMALLVPESLGLPASLRAGAAPSALPSNKTAAHA
jgi:hypothetical protein